MEIYIAMYIIIFIVGLMYEAVGGIKNRKAKFYYIVFCSTILTLIAGLRGENVGSDTLNYRNLFINIVENPFWVSIHGGIEFGFVILNKFIALFTYNPQILIFALSLLSITLFGIFIYRMEVDALFAYIIFIATVYITTFNSTRQMIACAFICNAFYYLIRNKYRNFFILTFFAFSFHYSSIILIPLFVYLHKTKSRKICVLTAIVSILINLVYEQLVNIFLILIPTYSHYIDSFWFSQTRDVRWGILLWISMIGVSSAAYFIKFKRRKRFSFPSVLSTCNEDILYPILATFTFIFVSFAFMSTKFWLAARIAIYFNIYFVILLPNVISRIPVAFKIILVPIIFIAFFCYFVLGTANGYNTHYYFYFH